MLGNGGGHNSDRASAGDQHILANQIKRQGRMHRIAQRVQNCPDIVTDIVGQRHNVKGRQAQVLSKSPRLVHPDPAGLRVQMKAARAAGAAVFANQMPLARNPLANGQIGHVFTHLNNLSGKLMPGNQRHRHSFLRPLVPVPDMDIGAANAGFVNLDQHIIRADFRHRLALHPQAFLCLRLYQRLHPV